MIGALVRIAVVTKPPRPKRCNPSGPCHLADALVASGHGGEFTVAQECSASLAQASVAPIRRATSLITGESNAMSAARMRRNRPFGWLSWTAIEVISASIGMAPAWLATSGAPPSTGRFSAPETSTRNHFSYTGRIAGNQTLSVKCGSKPKSSTS